MSNQSDPIRSAYYRSTIARLETSSDVAGSLKKLTRLEEKFAQKAQDFKVQREDALRQVKGDMGWGQAFPIMKLDHQISTLQILAHLASQAKDVQDEKQQRSLQLKR